MLIAVYVNAGNDKNGNPRRGWAIFGDSSRKFVDEGYDGPDALSRVYGDNIDDTYPALTVTPGQYQDLKRGKTAGTSKPRHRY
ncbi:MAG TPA: hypothetical protein VMW56_02555 [Candidatus Margulisiibacteriota bacterium]|nr:hypothetical protein [Candidatus Margulisiibacteriota bacterium]